VGKKKPYYWVDDPPHIYVDHEKQPLKKWESWHEGAYHFRAEVQVSPTAFTIPKFLRDPGSPSQNAFMEPKCADCISETGDERHLFRSSSENITIDA